MAKRANKRPQKRKKALSNPQPKAATKPRRKTIEFLADKKQVLHVGCGQARKEQMPKLFHGDEWQEIRLDLSEGAQPDILGDIRHMPEVPSDSMDALYSSHNVEHVYAHEVPLVMKEFFRVLKPGGTALVTLPDIQAVALEVAKGRLVEPLYESPSGPISAMDIMYGHIVSLQRGEMGMAHKTGFTGHVLGRYLLETGFHNVYVSKDPSSFALWARAIKPKKGLETEHKANIRGDYTQAVVDLPDPEERRDDLEGEPQLWTPLALGKVTAASVQPETNDNPDNTQSSLF